ncbi:MAG: 2OG-Fe dioxygenase family protein [Gammaproteobacteria bacterium]|nr:2OG-Fe dioxygenase family protein [Gammaproteobacteria bacterium]
MNTLTNNDNSCNYIQQDDVPVVRLLAHPWSSKLGLGFSIGEIAAFDGEAAIAAIKLKGIYASLEVDPYDPLRTRRRGYAQGALFVDDNRTQVVFYKSLVHKQNDNVEFPSRPRVLPSIPLGNAFHPELTKMIEAAWRCCVPQELNAVAGFHWKAHMLRLQPSENVPAQATPPAPHKDDACWVFVLVEDKQNVIGGENTLYNNQKQPLASFTLSPGQYFALDDRRFYHHVEALYLKSGAEQGYRDVLVIELNTLTPSCL